MAAGDILSCEVLATGWQAKVVIDDFKDGGTYDFGDIDTDVANAKFVMTVVSEGYNTSGTLGTITRTVYGTRVCQKAYPNHATAEETEAAGDVELTIALSDYVYDDDNTGAGKSGTAPTVTISAGWYTDSGTGGSSAASNAATALTVTNSSTQDYPKVAGARWATVPYQRFTATFDIEMVAFHHHATDGKPLACVKLNDGTTDTYVTAMAKSAQADSLPCYVHTIDATDYTANSNVTLNFTCYPWVGDADSVVTSVGGSVNALTLGPLQLRADKDNDEPVYYAVVDTAGSDTTGAVSTSATTAGTTPFLTVRKAVDALSTANGGKADFCEVLLNAGSHIIGSSGNGSCTAGWVTIKPNTNTGATKSTAKIAGDLGANVYARGWTKYQSITFEPTGYLLGGAAGRYLWLDDCAVNRATYSTTQPFGEYPHIYVTHCTSDKVNAFGPNGTANIGALIRGCSATDTTGLTGSGYGPRALLTTTLNGQDTRACKLADISASNTVIAYNHVSGDADTGNACITGSGAYDDCAIICNIIERSAGTQVAVSLWSDSNTTSNKNILLWHNTIAGERANVGYNEGTSAVTRTLYSVKYNSFEEFDTKHDVFKLDGTRTGAWSVTYGVGAIGNHADNELFPPYEYGIRGTSNSASGYVDDQSVIGGGAGGGDYTPDTGSILIGKIASAADVVIPWDINGVAYAAGGCAGAITLSGAQSLTLPTIASTATLGAPTLTAGAVTLSLPAIASVSTLAAPTLTAGSVTVSLPAIASGVTLAAPTLTPGAVGLSLPAIASTATLAAPTLSAGPVTLSLPAIASTATLAAPTLAAEGVVALPVIASGATLYAPTLTPGAVAISLPTITSVSTLAAPTLTHAGASLSLSVIGSTVTLLAPVLTPGTVGLSLPLIASGALLYAPTVVDGAIPIPAAILVGTITTRRGITAGAITIKGRS